MSGPVAQHTTYRGCDRGSRYCAPRSPPIGHGGSIKLLSTDQSSRHTKAWLSAPGPGEIVPPRTVGGCHRAFTPPRARIRVGYKGGWSGTGAAPITARPGASLSHVDTRPPPPLPTRAGPAGRASHVTSHQNGARDQASPGRRSGPTLVRRPQCTRRERAVPQRREAQLSPNRKIGSRGAT